MGFVFSSEFRLFQNQTKCKMSRTEDQIAIPNLNFIFPNSEIEESDNGHYFNQIYLPEEVFILIFSFVPPSDILKLGLVCKKWYNIIKMHSLWNTIYFRKYKKIPKHLPWYTFYALFRSPIYFEGNLLKNNCGQEKFKYWKCIGNGGNKFRVENEPVGSDPYPIDCPDFVNATSCFVTSYGICTKNQVIHLSNNLIKYIVNKHKPHIYASEWVAGRFDCGGTYTLTLTLYSLPQKSAENSVEEDSEDEFRENAIEEDLENVFPVIDEYHSSRNLVVMEVRELFKYNGNEATKWKKVEVVLQDYKEEVSDIVFEHAGVDNQFWLGHYGPKMAGGVVKLLFDSMEPDNFQSASYDSSDEN
ncbi:hypothetical protein WA026_018761 [Henosepilachna vigintioctopunctata]|uniref:F-box protein n=1 Tax=Henosepilachna vigintioctopunctata TaxID=420089 RepID=A0AAW1TW21_9CUCU